RFNARGVPQPVQSGSRDPASPRRHTRADLADVAEQVFEEAPLATEGRRLVVLRIDPGDLLEPAALDRGDVVVGVEMHREHRMPGDPRLAERPLGRAARNVVPDRLAELAHEARAAERALDRLAVVDARLDRLQQDFVGEIPAMALDLDAA